MNKNKKKTTEPDQFTGTFYKRVHRTNDGRRCVYLYSNADETATVIGDDLPEFCLPVTFTGKWRISQRGKQFYADMALCELPTDSELITNYIASLKLGITERLAKLMVESVGPENFWQELETDPMQFCAVRGVVPQAITMLQTQVKKIATQQSLFKLFGNDLSCDGRQYKRICDYFSNDVEQMSKSIMANPFTLMKCGYTFSDLDRFCSSHTIFPVNDYRRLLAATQQILMDAKSESHVGLPCEELTSKVISLLKKYGNVSPDDVAAFLQTAERAGDIISSNSLVYLPRSFKEEMTITNIMLSLLRKADDAVDDTAFEETMTEYAAAKGFSLSPDQQKAVKTALQKSVVVITGGPGTGKSSILDAILTCWKKFHDDNWLLMAPTGKAAVRMTETTGQPATTIHSTLGLNVGNEDPDEMDLMHNSLDASLIVVDECSMIDQTVMASLAMALSEDENKVQHLILVGDPQQLPSVGWGNILADFISSEVIPVCRLNTIYRQGKGNPIITNSTKMQNGDVELEWNQSFRRYHEGDDEANKRCACRLYQRCVSQFGIENVAMLSPYHHATAIGTDSLNSLLQEAMNPNKGQGEIKALGRIFRNGDRVMQLRNTDDLSNGDIGTITDIDSSARETEPCIFVRFENGIEASYLRDDLGQLELAYAISIHKSQGSQYKTIVIVLPNKTTPFLKRNLLYTAITRSSGNVAIISPTSTISYCILNDKKDERHTNLISRLQPNIEAYDEDLVVEESAASVADDAAFVYIPGTEDCAVPISDTELDNYEFVYEPKEPSDFDL